MDDSKPNCHDNCESPSLSFQARILDRKIERCALQESFSSNLGRKGPSAGRRVSDRSVRAMVRLFEKSAEASRDQRSSSARAPSGTAPKNEDRDGKEASREEHGTSNDSDSKATTRRPEPGLKQGTDRSIATAPAMLPTQVGYQVEEYSLTLLKHKCYFNNRPLARCLDDYHDGEQEKSSREETAVRSANRTPIRKNKENQAGGNGKEEKANIDTVTPRRNGGSSPIQQLKDLMNELLTWQGFSESKSSDTHPEPEEREPADVEAFWSDLRSQLQIDEDELYGESSRPTEDGGSVTVHQMGIEDRNWPPEISASSLPSLCYSESEPELVPPPVPTRPPPPVPTAVRTPSRSTEFPRRRQHSTAPSLELFPDPDMDYPSWDQPPPTPSVRLSRSTPGSVDISDFPFDISELPSSLFRQRQSRPSSSARDANLNHSRYPSSGSSVWVRPPTWRSPSSLSYPSPPPSLPPPPIPTSTATRYQYHCHSRHRHQSHNHHASKTSTATSATTNSAITSGSGGGLRSITSSRRTPKTSTSSTATRATRAGSGNDLSGPRPGVPLRRLTTEEKLSEIDAFLSPALDGTETTAPREYS